MLPSFEPHVSEEVLAEDRCCLCWKKKRSFPPAMKYSRQPILAWGQKRGLGENTRIAGQKTLESAHERRNISTVTNSRGKFVAVVGR